ncbi:MAG: creatininase family protein, partial [Acidimicrobiales bacterium]
TGAIEAHGPHLPLDADTHQAEAIARLLAERVGALVAPPIVYGYSTTFSSFVGTISLSAETYQQVVVEICESLVQSGFKRLLLLNGNRPNGTANDVAARRVSDAHCGDPQLSITAVSYWEPAASAIHALRRSAVGGMGHGGEFETSLQLALRPELVHIERLEGLQPPLVGWDLVAPGSPARSYGAHPDPAKGHPAIFGDPSVASSDAGQRFLDAVIDALVVAVAEIQGSYAERRATVVDSPA